MGRIRYRNKIGNGLRFDGVDDYITFAQNSDFKINALDVEMTLKRNATGGSNSGLFYLYSDGPSTSGDAIGFTFNSQGRIIVTASTNGGFKTSRFSPQNILKPIGKVFTLRGEYRGAGNGGYLRAYQNDVLAVEGGVPFAFEYSNTRTVGSVGAYINDLGNTLFHANVTIYSLKVTDRINDQVILHYNFNQTNASDTLFDLSGNGNHGTFEGFSNTTDYGGGAWVDELGNTAI